MSTTTEKKWTVNAIKDAMRAAGSHWFDPDTMRCFGTKVLPTVYQGPGGIYFVTQDDQYRRELPKRFTVRRYNPVDNDIDTVGEMNEFANQSAAKKAARAAAGGVKAETFAEDFKPVSVLEQFIDDLRKHGGATGKIDDLAAELIEKARLHHRYTEAHCNGTWPYGKTWDGADTGNHPAVVRQCQGRIIILADKVGAASVLFSGDPRGATVKLTFKDGFTNDFGKEGYCVPTEA